MIKKKKIAHNFLEIQRHESMESNRSASSTGSCGKAGYHGNDHVNILPQPSTTSIGEAIPHLSHLQQHSDVTGLSTTYVVNNAFIQPNALPKTPRNRDRRVKSSYYGKSLG